MSPTADLSSRTCVLLYAALAVSVMHHVDHILRVDHSGWPFKHEVTPFTFSLLAYPIILFGLFGSARLFWVRFALLVGATAFALFAHSVVETPWMQYAMWRHNCSADPAASPDLRNLLDTQSPTLGIAAVFVSMTLNLVAVGSTVSMLVDGLRRAPLTVMR